MRTVNKIVFAAGNLATSLQSAPIDLESLSGFSVQGVVTGTVTATFKLQVSNDLGSDAQGDGVTNWTDLPNSSQSISNAGSFILNFDGQHYRWVRAVSTPGTGAGTLTATISAKGVS